MSLVRSSLLLCLGGCLIGADPRADHADVGEACEEDWDCQKGLVCNYDGLGEDGSIYTCRTECREDDECDAGEVCDGVACVDEEEL